MRRTTRIQKFLSLLLAFCMVLVLLPATAFAVSDTKPEDDWTQQIEDRIDIHETENDALSFDEAGNDVFPATLGDLPEELETDSFESKERAETGKVEKLDVMQEDEVAVMVETNGFSIYTVEFTYNMLEYVLPGDSSVAMSEILTTLGLTGEVEAVEISDTSLFSVSNAAGEWIVTAHQSFSTTEWMKVTINGVAYEITVTDSTPSEVGQGFSVTCSGSTFTITRSDTSAAASVKYRTVSQSAVAGIHFTAVSGTLTFASGQSSKTVKVAETKATATEDFFYMSGSTRTYGFEVMAASNNQLLASCQRTLDNNTGLALSSSGLYSAKTATVFTDETKVTDSGYNQAYHAVPLDAYTTGEREYFRLTGARLLMAVDLEVKESDDGYQYIQIIANSSAYASGNGDGDPGSIGASSYLAGFGHAPGTKNTTYAKYTFPLTSAGDNCAAIDAAWNFSPYNNTVGKLYTQKFASASRDDDGRIILPSDLSMLGIRFDASGSNDDDWYAKNVIASLQAVDTAAPTITNTYVSEGTYGYGDTVTIALRFSEVIRIVGKNPYLNTNFGTFSYGGGSGTNVLYFTKQMRDSTSAKSGLQVTGLANAGNIKDLASNVFSSFSGYTFSGVAYEGSLSVTINYNNGTGATGDAGRMRLHATYTFPAAQTYQSRAPQGHEFDCYKVGDTVYHPGDTLELTDNLTVDLQWKPIVYTVRFVNWDGTELQSGPVTYGTVPEYTGQTPTRPADAQYTYTFAGWDKEITAVSGDTTYTAAYSTTTNEYTVTFKNYDGTVLQTSSVAYGETPAYTGETPAKEQTAEKTHTFTGWTPEVVPVTGDATYTATFTDATRTYTITFADYDGTVLQSGSVAYGETPAYTGSTPVRPDEGETRYTFTGWTPEITAVTDEATYSAAYSTTQLYPITLPEGVAADKALAVPGETVTLTVTAPAAYTAELTYTAAGSSPVSIPETEGAYTFAMPAAPVTVGASFSLTWAGLQTLLIAGGTVKLLCDVTAEAYSSSLKVPARVTVTLDLNGHTVDRALTTATADGYVIEAIGSLTLRDSSAGGTGRITGGYSTGDGGGVCAFGTFIMEGGTISGNSANRGGVYVGVNQTFTMSGGTITGNTASNGGGVYVNGSFIMNGGTITSNTASNNGGGVSVNGNATFNMESGTITGNSTTRYGGGVYVHTDGTFIMEGGTITGNTAGYDGCGVYNNGTFSVSGSPVVTGNLDGIDPNNVYLCNNKRINLSGPLTDGAALGVRMYNIYGIFTNGWADMMGTADPAAYFTSDRSDYAYQVYLSGGEAAQGQFHTVTVADGIEHGAVTADKASAVSGDTVTLTVTPEAGYVLETLTVKQGEMDLTTTPGENGAWTFTMPGLDVTVTATFIMTWSSLNDALWSDCTITLPYDIIAGSGNGQLIIPSGVTVTLDLNGHTINRGLSEATTNGIAVAVRGGASLTVKDSASGGRITGGNSSGLCGGVHVQGSFIMEGGTISGNTASANGGGVYVNGGSFTMKGGAISGNTASSYGGGVYVNGGTFTMKGGTISGNTARSNGGGVYVAPDGTFTMQGGTISNNTAYEGGGVLVGSYSTSAGTFTMTGGMISGNNAVDGGGVCVYGTFSVGGSPVVTGNTKESYGTANNVYLSSGKAITLSGELSGGASLGVTMNTPGVFTSGWAAQMGTASPAGFFISDNSAYAAHLGTGGEAELGQAYTVAVTNGITHGTVTSDKASSAAGDTVTLTVTPDAGYTLDTLTVMQGETEVAVTNNQFTMPAGDVTVNATFKLSGPVINGHNLVLSGEIGVMFKVTLPEDFDGTGSYMDFVLSDTRAETMAIADAKKEGNSYWFTCYVNALELADTITATYYYGTETVSNTYSVMYYISAAKAAYPSNTALMNLVNALQNYGHYMQVSGWTDDKASHTTIAEASSLVQNDIDAARNGVEGMEIQKQDLDKAGIDDVMFSLTLNAETKINIFVKLKDGVTLTSPGNYKAVTIGSETYYQLTSEKIGAGNLGITYTFTITTSLDTAKVKASAMSYVHAVVKSGSSFIDSKQLAMTAYYNYYKAAIAYVVSQNQ